MNKQLEGERQKEREIHGMKAVGSGDPNSAKEQKKVVIYVSVYER